MLQDDDKYETNDLALAATLVECGHALLQLDRSNPSRVVFIFIDTDESQQVIADYWLNRITVNPKSYFDTLKHLKTRIYAG